MRRSPCLLPVRASAFARLFAPGVEAGSISASTTPEASTRRRSRMDLATVPHRPAAARPSLPAEPRWRERYPKQKGGVIRRTLGDSTLTWFPPSARTE